MCFYLNGLNVTAPLISAPQSLLVLLFFLIFLAIFYNIGVKFAVQRERFFTGACQLRSR